MQRGTAIIMTEVTQQLATADLDHTPVRQISEPGAAKTHQDNEVASNDEAPHRIKRKRRKHKKVKPHRDPEQIKQLRLQRLNMKRQGQWNNRFINDTIPQMFISKGRKKKSQIVRRHKSPIQTVYLDKDLPSNKLPNIMRINDKDEINKHTQKSFNIRTVGGKKEPFRRGKKFRKSEDHSIDVKLPLKVEQMHVDKVLTKPKEASEEKLKAKLEQKTKIHAINPSYKALLLDLIQCCSGKSGKQLKVMLENEIISIGSKKNPYDRIQNMIKERKQLLKNIAEAGEKATLGAYLEFQLASISLIEEILRFKAKWEEQYFKMGITKKVQYNYQGSNYLLTINEEVKEINPQQTDPFLVAKTNRLQELVGSALKEQQQRQRKQMLLKIRACELLLIEEALS